MTFIRIVVAGTPLLAKLEWEAAPETCEVFNQLLPLRSEIKQARWSGEALWIPMGQVRYSIKTERHKHAPFPGELLFYSGSESETEILVPYGQTRFGCARGPLYGNHFATIVDSDELLRKVAELTWGAGTQEIAIDVVKPK